MIGKDVTPTPSDAEFHEASAAGSKHTTVGTARPTDALWRIVMVRIAHDAETQLYFERRVKEGRTTHEVIRILKRYVAREVYPPATYLAARSPS